MVAGSEQRVSVARARAPRSPPGGPCRSARGRTWIGSTRRWHRAAAQWLAPAPGPALARAILSGPPRPDRSRRPAPGA